MASTERMQATRYGTIQILMVDVRHSSLTAARSFLFVPGNDERKLRKALALEADALIVDLEDAVPFAEKAAARDGLAEALAGGKAAGAVFVRINAATTPMGAADWRTVRDLGVTGVVLPKAEAAALDSLSGDGPPIVALVETAIGLRDVNVLATHSRTARLALGGVDLGLELGLESRPDGQELLMARSQLVLASAAASLPPPIDVVNVAVKDLAALEHEATLARSLGFGAKLCVHPGQVSVVNRVFTPADEEVSHAATVVAAYERAIEEGRGSVELGGEMVDLPVAERARAVLARAKRRH